MLGRGVRSPNMVERYITLLPVGFDRYDYLGYPDEAGPPLFNPRQQATF